MMTSYMVCGISVGFPRALTRCEARVGHSPLLHVHDRIRFGRKYRPSQLPVQQIRNCWQEKSPLQLGTMLGSERSIIRVFPFFKGIELLPSRSRSTCRPWKSGIWVDGSTLLFFIGLLVFVPFVLIWSFTPIDPPSSWLGFQDDLSPRTFLKNFEVN